MRKYGSLIAFLLVVFAAALTGSLFTPGSWYAGLAKPSWTPPNWLFPVAWTTLYVMIAVAGWLVWRAEGFRAAMGFWTAQLVLNAAWSWIMFGEKQIGWALADIVAMLVAIVGFIVTARRASGAAAALFVPYLAWVSFAAALNFAIWRLNG